MPQPAILKWIGGLIVVGALLIGASPAAAPATTIISDDFSSGIDPSIYQPLGSAILTWDTSDPGDPHMRVSVFNTEDGLQINMPTGLPGNPSPLCMELFQDILNTDFPQGFAWQHSIEMVNQSDPSMTGRVELAASRSAWNRCIYTLKWGSNTVMVGFLEPADGATAKWECPGIKKVKFDWLPPEMPGGPERIQIEVDSDAAGDCQFKTTKPSPIQHDPGGGPPPANAYRITKWEVTAVEEREGECKA
jgi:hypothetical protein